MDVLRVKQCLRACLRAETNAKLRLMEVVASNIVASETSALVLGCSAEIGAAVQ